MRLRSIRSAAAATVAALAVLTAACGDGGGEDPSPTPSPATDTGVQAVIGSSDLAVGKQRFSFVILKDDVPITEPSVYVRFFKLTGGSQELVGEGPIPYEPVGTESLDGHDDDGHEATEVEIRGVYYAYVDFDVAGDWGAGFSVGDRYDAQSEARVRFTVAAEPQTVGVGDQAIAVDNLTLADAPLEQIDTSPEPDEAFHQVSIADAITSGKPAVIAFATPAFCQTRTCGPVMEVVRAAAAQAGGGLQFVHVEPYELDSEGQLALKDGQLALSEAGVAWNLPTEPWVFVVDSAGTVVARFDGPFALSELLAAIDQAA